MLIGGVPSTRTAVNAVTLNPLDYGGYTTREVYSVDDVRVTLDPNQGWQCACRRYVRGAECSHISQARVFKQMRGSKPDDDTIELEVTAEELQALYIAASVEHADYRHDEPVARPERVRRPSRWGAALAAAAIAAVSSGITYVATDRQQPIRVVETPLPAPLTTTAPEDPPPAPLKFVNPFDATEVFEFSPGVSENAAREAVAEILRSRARQRLATAVDAPGRGSKPIRHGKPEPAARLVNRS